MASLSRLADGRRIIQYADVDGRRPKIHLGKVNQRTAQAIKLRVENLIHAKLSGVSPDQETSEWLSKIDGPLANKLANVGLIPRRETATLKAFLDSYVESRHDLKPRTQFLLKETARALTEFFGAMKPLKDILPGHADDFHLHLKRNLAENTVRRRCGRAKQFFKAAVRKGLIPSNPFADLKSSVQGNKDRFYFVTSGEADKVLEACPDAQWRLIVALSRFGGLRCPSETFALQWEDVDWQNARITVRSPKTEHIEGHESRVIPLFPELRPHLEDAFELAEPGTQFVITAHRRQGTNTNLRTHLERIIKRAGLKPWPRLFHNMRASRQNELEETFPSHVVCAWIGNSPSVAKEHYLHVRPEHYEQAVQNPVHAVQNPVRLAAAASRPVPPSESGDAEKTPVFACQAGTGGIRRSVQMPPLGLEPRTY